MAKKTIHAATSARREAEENASKLYKLFVTKRTLDEQMKELKEALIEYAETHPEEFARAKSFKIGNVTLKKTDEKVYVPGDAFSPAEFCKAYPQSIKFSLVKSKMLNIDLDQWDIEEDVEEDVITVEVKAA